MAFSMQNNSHLNACIDHLSPGNPVCHLELSEISCILFFHGFMLSFLVLFINSLILISFLVLLYFSLIICIFNTVTAWAQQGFVRCCSMTVMTRWVVEFMESELAAYWYRRGPEFHLGILSYGYHWKWHKTSFNQTSASRLCIWANQVTTVGA